ncbi:MAG: isochorismatase family cysteine hydrolase [Candidatus Aenigmatarchaeota archaeon]
MTKINPKKSALLVIDITNLCCSVKCERHASHGRIRRMVPNLVKFIEEYKKRSLGPVIYTNCTKWDKKHLAPNIVELYKDPKCRWYSKDRSGFSEKFYKVRPGKDDFIVTKNTYDAFSNPKLEKMLKKKRVKRLIVTGIFGDGCVHTTINSGFSKGYSFIILKDLIETTNAKSRQDLQRLLKNYSWPLMFGKTIVSKEFLRVAGKI